MKEELIVLGTGHAMVQKCYNTCFAIRDEKDRYFLVDAGGGNQILIQLEKAGIPVTKIHHMFLTHEHTDHVLGAVWVVRAITSAMRKGRYEGNFHIYGHRELMEKIEAICKMTLPGKSSPLFGDRIIMNPVEDGEERDILDYKMQFFDIRSKKAKQFGFVMTFSDGRKLTCCGDEPYQEHCEVYAKDADWLLHEAFCLYGERDVYHPYEISHSTVKDACELASKLAVKNIVLWHTEDDNIRRRKSLYKKEGRKYFKGNIFVPYDLERIPL